MKPFRFPILDSRFSASAPLGFAGSRFSILVFALALSALCASCGDDDKSSSGSNSASAQFEVAAWKPTIKACTASFTCYQDTNNAFISIIGIKTVEECSRYQNENYDKVLQQIGCTRKEFETIATKSLASYARCVEELSSQPNSNLCGNMKPSGTGFYPADEAESFVHKIPECQEAYELIADGHTRNDGSCSGNLSISAFAAPRR